MRFSDNVWVWAKASSYSGTRTGINSARVSSANPYSGSRSLAFGELYRSYTGVKQNLPGISASRVVVSFWLVWDPQGSTRTAEQNSIQLSVGGSLRGCWENDYNTTWSQRSVVFDNANANVDIQLTASVSMTNVHFMGDLVCT